MKVVKLPKLVHGFDVETQSLKPTAYILSGSIQTFDIQQLKRVDGIYGTIDPNDPDARCFDVDPSTVDWWHGKGDPQYAPSVTSRTEAYSGTTPMPQVLKTWTEYLDKYKSEESVIVTRGPEFDIPIMMNALKECGVYMGLFRRFTMNDSDRTMERVLSMLGLNGDLHLEESRWMNGEVFDAHNPKHDAALSAYRTARVYHMCNLIHEYGSDVAKEAHELLQKDEYVPIAFLNLLRER